MARNSRKFFPLLIILLIIISGCLPGDIPQPEILIPMTQTPSSPSKNQELPNAFRILALGDSYTIGEGVGQEDRWPVQLANRLRSEGLPVDEPLIIARTGWTTDELTAAVDRNAPAGSFDMVTLLIGVNNQYRGRDIEEYRTGFRDLLERSVAFAGGQPQGVIVLSIPDWGVTPFAQGRDRSLIAAQIDAFNQVNREESINAGAVYVNITPISREAIDDPGLLAADGLHPSGKMYAAWVDAVLAEINKR
jgi:lysophospholipase L1-like esterase